MFTFITNFFKHNHADKSFAERLAIELYSNVPAPLIQDYYSSDDEKPEKENNKVKTLIEETAWKLAQYKDLHKVGVYRKARIHQLFAEKLEELGYEKTIVKKINRFLLVKVP